MSIRSHGDPIQVEERIECILATALKERAAVSRGLLVELPDSKAVDGQANLFCVPEVCDSIVDRTNGRTFLYTPC